MAISIDTATLDDCDAIAALIAESAHGLGQNDYTPAEIDAALGSAWGLDTQLVRDGTYFLVHVDGGLAACGGWSYRSTLFGADGEGSRNAELLDPAKDSARIRAFFVRPEFARQGIGTLLLEHCENEAKKAGFNSYTLGSTLPGLRLYTVRGYIASDAVEYDLGDGMSMQVIPMTKVGLDETPPPGSARTTRAV
ncbi:MAG: GNAT family N-acetyltransferase [Gammaproteobacteria bacterium]|nr:GNAT family N-acetyltransferase [Gammaproteobacteria bacterium]MCZ6852850.1 GNAT family N-acetyltransferase [Gammaproteobacteria bacterium]